MADDAPTQLPQNTVDNTPISPARPGGNERKNSLEKQLLHRPAREELVESEYFVPALPRPNSISDTHHYFTSK